jgi:RNA polymerase sigma-70 factor (ECF subfamily)
MQTGCKACNDETLQILWEALHDRLFRFILSRVDNEDDAQDILQSVFIKIHASLDTVRELDRIESWVFQITRNCIKDFYRQPGKAPLDENIPVFDEYASHDPTFQVSEYVHEVVSSLPSIYREAIELADYQGMSQQEAARKLNISVSGMKSRVQRARAMVREIMLACCHFEFDTRGIVMEYYDSCRICENQPEKM